MHFAPRLMNWITSCKLGWASRNFSSASTLHHIRYGAYKRRKYDILQFPSVVTIFEIKGGGNFLRGICLRLMTLQRWHQANKKKKNSLCSENCGVDKFLGTYWKDNQNKFFIVLKTEQLSWPLPKTSHHKKHNSNNSRTAELAQKEVERIKEPDQNTSFSHS